MKKYILSSLVVLSVATLFTACNDMLDTDPRVTELTAATFPGKPGGQQTREHFRQQCVRTGPYPVILGK